MIADILHTGDKPPVIFDLDGTITKRDTYLPFLWECSLLYGYFRVAAITLPVDVAMFYAGRITNTTLKERFLAKAIGNIEMDRLGIAADCFVRKLVKNGLFNFMDSLLSDYLAAGYKVVLATASFDFYVHRIASALGISHYVCTHAEVKKNRLTGRIQGRNCYGAEKLRRIQEAFGNGFTEDAIVFSDHYSDFPLLASAHTGILVNPSHKTKRFMHHRGYRFERLPADVTLLYLRKRLCAV